jgi:hypothetical protein
VLAAESSDVLGWLSSGHLLRNKRTVLDKPQASYDLGVARQEVSATVEREVQELVLTQSQRDLISSEGPLSTPRTDAQIWRRERHFMPPMDRTEL